MKRLLSALFLLLTCTTQGLAHDIVVHVQGKSTVTSELPAAQSQALFDALQDTSTTIEDEILRQLRLLDLGGARYQSATITVDDGVDIALEATSASSFEARAEGFGFDVHGHFSCPSAVAGIACKYVNFAVDVDHFAGTGQFDFRTGAAALQVGANSVDVNITTKLTFFAKLLIRKLVREFEAYAVEPLAEEAVGTALDLIDLEGQLFDVTELLDQVDPVLTSALGLNVMQLLEAPVQGLEVDLRLQPPAGSQPGRINVTIQHRTPTSLRASLSVDRRATLIWSGVPNAAQYKIFSMTHNESSYRHVGTTVGTQWTGQPFAHTNSPTIHHFVVVAVNSLGVESSPSWGAQIFLRDEDCPFALDGPCLSDSDPI